MAARSTSIELSPQAAVTPSDTDVELPETDIEQPDTPPRHEFSLPPVDGGKDAWLCLAAGFALDALMWGFQFAFGVWQDYYSTHAPFAGSTNIAIIGTCSMGITYLDAPLLMTLIRLYPRLARWGPVTGLVVICLALVASSFATTVTQLVATQGVLYAVGCSLAYYPCIVYLDQWFVRRKGLAYGIMWSGTGIAGVVLPLLFESLLSSLGFRTTLRLWAAVVFVLAVPLAYFIKPRLPPPPPLPSSSSSSSSSPPAARHSHSHPSIVAWAFRPPFLLYQIANSLEALGFFLPAIYLPSYARGVLDAGSFPAVLTVLLINVASVVGCVAMGSLIDRLHVTTCVLVSTVGACVAVFLLWGLGSSLPVLYLFCLVYGLFAGSFTSTWPGIMRQFTAATTTDGPDGSGNPSSVNARPGTVADPTMVFALLALGRGIGNVASGPLSEALIGGFPWRGAGGQSAWGYGSGYGALIAFTGTTALLGGGSYLWRQLGWL